MGKTLILKRKPKKNLILKKKRQAPKKQKGNRYA